MTWFRNFRLWLGEGRFWVLAGMLGVTGIASFVLQFVAMDNALVFQNILVATFVVSALAIIGTRMDQHQRQIWAAVLVPAIGLVLLGVFFVQQFLLIFIGAAFGWVLVGLLVFGRNRAPMQYREAIQALRKNDYKTAVNVLDDLIRDESEIANHYRLRGRILRLWGKTGRARRDYEAMLKYSTNDSLRAEAYNELSELELQTGNYQAALDAAGHAYELVPDDWVAAYNLGMVQDRMGLSADALDSLGKALDVGVPDSRHRLLIYLWQARAHMRQRDVAAATAAIKQLEEEGRGLSEWQKILPDEQAAVLRDVLETDIQQAQALIDGDLSVTDLSPQEIS